MISSNHFSKQKDKGIKSLKESYSVFNTASTSSEGE